jgi:hypothetical protein
VQGRGRRGRKQRRGFERWKEGEGEGLAPTGGTRWSERGRGKGRSGGRAEEGSGPGVAHAGKGGGRGELAGPVERKKRGGEMGRGERAGPRGLGCFLFLFFSFSFPTLKLFKQFYLNPNKFEFKSYKLNTRKAMLQHECTNMLTL